MVGKYVPITESDATELGSYTLRSILTELFATARSSPRSSPTRGAAQPRPRSTAGRPTCSARRAGARLWVAADGSGTLLRAVGPKSAPSDLVFSDWGRAEDVHRRRRPRKIVEG